MDIFPPQMRRTTNTNTLIVTKQALFHDWQRLFCVNKMLVRLQRPKIDDVVEPVKFGPETRHLKTCPRTTVDHFLNMSIYDDFREWNAREPGNSL